MASFLCTRWAGRASSGESLACAERMAEARPETTTNSNLFLSGGRHSLSVRLSHSPSWLPKATFIPNSLACFWPDFQTAAVGGARPGDRRWRVSLAFRVGRWQSGAHRACLSGTEEW